MPIECNTFMGDTIERLCPVEPGKLNTYFAENIGKVILAACDDKDRGGKFYLLDSKEYDDKMGGLETVTHEDLACFKSEIIGPGSMAVIALGEAENSPLIFFSHYSTN